MRRKLKNQPVLSSRKIELTYEFKHNVLILIGYTSSYLYDEGFCIPTVLTPYTIV